MEDSEKLEQTLQELKRLREISHTAVAKLISGVIPIRIYIDRIILAGLPVYSLRKFTLQEKVEIILTNDDCGLVVGNVKNASDEWCKNILIPMSELIHILEKCYEIGRYDAKS